VKIDFDGDYKSGILAPVNNLVPGAGTTIPGTSNQTVRVLCRCICQKCGKSPVTTAWPQWAIHYSLAYTSWSQFQELKATGNNGQTLFYKDESFKDAYRIALGTTYYYDKTGLSVPVSHLMTARFRPTNVPSPSRIRTVCG
jgi:long-chain fatty acid transport protein